MFPFIARCATNGSTDLSSGTVTDWENVTGCTYANTALNERRPMAEDEGPARGGPGPAYGGPRPACGGPRPACGGPPEADAWVSLVGELLWRRHRWEAQAWMRLADKLLQRWHR